MIERTWREQPAAEPCPRCHLYHGPEVHHCEPSTVVEACSCGKLRPIHAGPADRVPLTRRDRRRSRKT